MLDRSPEAILARSMQRARYSSDPARHAMAGIRAVAKIERGETERVTERAINVGACPGSGARDGRSAPSWKAQWRFRSTDQWTYVVNSEQLHIQYTSEDAALRAAVYVRNQALKINS